MKGLSRRGAVRLEFAIIGLGVVALLLIFQPLSLGLFSAGCGLVVLAGLLNNLLPLAQPGVAVRSILLAAAIIALVFACVLLLSISAAHLYGALLLTPPQATGPVPPSAPFWAQPLVWGIAGAALVFGGLVRFLSRGTP